MLSDYAVELLARTTFPPPRTPVACAVSGGPDSLALLALAVAAGCEATAYHVDHGLRPGSAEEANVVRDAADRLGASFVALKVSCAPGPNLEARARAARKKALPTGCATGHTADDQAETILLNLLRGSALDGLVGMRPGPEHPILAIRRAETERLVASLRLPVVRDPSNDDGRFRRNRVRHELLPLVNEIAGRDVVALLARQSQLLAEDADLLEALSALVDPTDAKALATAPAASARRALRRWLRSFSPERHPPDARAVERVLDVARGECLAAEIAGGTRIRRSKGRLVADAPATAHEDAAAAQPSTR